MEKDLVEALRTLGFSKNESKILSFLIEKGEASVQEISERIEVPAPHIYETLKVLYNKGCILKGVKRPVKYMAVADIKYYYDIGKEQVEEINRAVNIVSKHISSREEPKGTYLIGNYKTLRIKYLRFLREIRRSFKGIIPFSSLMDINLQKYIDSISSALDVKLVISDKKILEGYTISPPYIRYVEPPPPLLMGIFDDKILISAQLISNVFLAGFVSYEYEIISFYKEFFKHVWVDDYLRTLYKFRIRTPREY